MLVPFVFGEENVTCAAPKIMCGDLCVLSHCYNNSQCDDYNPYTADVCVQGGSCEARCDFTTSFNSTVEENVVNSTVDDSNLTLVQAVNYYRNESNNKTYVSGSFSVEKELSDDYILFIMNDPRGFIINRLDKAHFSVEPWRVTDEQLIWKLAGNESVMLIRYWFDEELSEEIVNNDVKIEETTKVREPNFSEKAYSKVSNRSDIFVSDKLNKIVTILFVVISVVILGFVVYMIKERKNRVKLIKEVKNG